MPKCDQIIELHKTTPSIPALPKVPDLERYVSSFFSSGKRFLMAAYQLLHMFYEMPFEGREGHFDKHREWIKGKLGETHPIYLT